MKNRITLVVWLLAFVGILPAQNKAIQSFLSYTTYAVPGEKPFIENAMAFECASVYYRQFEPGKFKASVEIQTIFKQGDKVCNYSKIALDSPVVTDTSKISGSFIDQQRFSLDNGEYTLEISILDLNSPTKTPVKSEQTVVINFPTEHPSVSDIMLVDTYSKAQTTTAFTKNGYNLIPRVYGYYLQNDHTLKFYAEAYNSDKYFKDGGQYIVNYYIESYESSMKMKNYNFIKRVNVEPVHVLLNEIDIKNLPTGNYYLVVEMRDRQNKLMASNSAFFQRYNPGCEVDMDDISALSLQGSFASEITNLDTLREYIRCLNPRCSESERDYSNNLVKTDDLKTMQQFFLNFWSTRAPLNPRAAWDEYYAQVKRVNASYSTRTKKGYMSDRGYVYLKYGTPDKICEEPFEPGAYPYEIWHYYQVANQRNKHFVFMSHDMVTNDYALIHSDVIGEVTNNRWQLMIYSRFRGPDYTGDIIDQTTVPDAWGTRAGELYNNPR